MAKSIMVTELFELSGEMAEMKDLDMSEYVYDRRLNMVIPRSRIENLSGNITKLIMNYVDSFCQLTQENLNTRAGTLVSNGFLPVGVEPLPLRNVVNTEFIIPSLKDRDIQYFQIKATSPVDAMFEANNEAVMHDIWVNKLDAAKIVHKRPHQISTMDLLKELI